MTLVLGCPKNERQGTFRRLWCETDSLIRPRRFGAILSDRRDLNSRMETWKASAVPGLATVAFSGVGGYCPRVLSNYGSCVTGVSVFTVSRIRLAYRGRLGRFPPAVSSRLLRPKRPDESGLQTVELRYCQHLLVLPEHLASSLSRVYFYPKGRKCPIRTDGGALPLNRFQDDSIKPL